jgi:proliferating cell nuclear antigen
MKVYDKNEYILILETVQCNVFKTLCDVLKDIIDDVNFIFDEIGMHVMALDGSHMAFVNLKLNSKSFENYYCPGKMLVGLNMSNLFKLVKTVTTADTMTMFVKKENTEKLGIMIENAEKNSRTVFHLNMLDIDEMEFRWPELKMEFMLELPSIDFQRMIRDMNNISQTLYITNTGKYLKLLCKGDFAQQETILGEYNNGLTIKQADSDITNKYSLKFLNLFTKATNLSSILKIYLKKDKPLIMVYNVANLGVLHLCLVPYTDDNDE